MLTAAQHAFWSANGYLIAEGVLPPSRLRPLRDALERRLRREGAAAGAEGSANPGVRRLCNLFAKGPQMERLATEPLALELARATVGDDFHFQSMNFHDPLPGDTRAHQLIHADRSFFANCRAFVNVIWAVDHLTERNGAPRLVPGSHKRPWPLHLDDAEAPVPGEIVATCPAGSAIFVHGDTWHGGRINRSAAPRRAIHIGYSCPATAPQYEIAATLTPEVCRRLGEHAARIPPPLASFNLDHDPTQGRSIADILRDADPAAR